MGVYLINDGCGLDQGQFFFRKLEPMLMAEVEEYGWQYYVPGTPL